MFDKLIVTQTLARVVATSIFVANSLSICSLVTVLRCTIIPTCQVLQTFKFEVADVNAPSENEQRTEPKVESSLEHVHFRRSSSHCPAVLL